MKFMKLFLLGLTLISGLLCVRQAYAQGNYQTYTNARFAYAIAYPADLLIPQGEADNGDGQKFISKDGRAVLLVYGSHNALNQKLKEAFAEASAPTDDRQVTYKILRADWFVVSGKAGEKIFYQKTLLKNGVFKTFRIEYDESQKNIYDTVTAKIAKSFKG
ncbi:MAG: hypothetical protein AB1757_29265 [Acidobacteriota bacterium]